MWYIMEKERVQGIRSLQYHYLTRTYESDLAIWLQKRGRKPLVIRGARQTGKSTLVREFARKFDYELIEINLEESVSFLRPAFERGSFDEIVTSLERAGGQSLRSSQQKILFLDEIQAIPMALQALRYFYEKLPELAVIAAGSTLEFILAAPTFSMPVGRLEFLAVAPLTFKEYLSAMQKGDLKEVIDDAHPKKPASLSLKQHHLLMQQLNDYFLTGGMPEAVAAAAEGQSSETICRSLLAAYRSDLQKYPSTGHIRDIVRTVFDRVPGLIGKKVKYSQLAPDRPARDVRKALNLLIEAGVIIECVHSHADGVPLQAQAEPEVRKLFFLDIGLMLTAQGAERSDIPDFQDPRFVNEGALAEQFVAQELSATLKQGEKTPLTYWLREGRSNNAEVDFIIACGKRVHPIEVKAGEAGTLRSLSEFKKAKHPRILMRLNASPPTESILSTDKEQTPLVSLPLYMTSEVLRIAKTY